MKTIVMILTYNERENIEKLIKEILKFPKIEILVVDDNSPDGTWKIVKRLMRDNKRVKLLLRKKDKGRGFAGIAGYRYCLEHDADYIIEMDADFSHNPKYLPNFLKAIKRADVVLGSRLIKDGSDSDRGIIRRTVTILANLYIKTMLGIKVTDGNSGYRCFRRKVLEELNPGNLISKGPDIVQEVLFKAHLKGFKIVEIPIEFIDRRLGKSKLSLGALFKGYVMVLRLKIGYIFGRL